MYIHAVVAWRNAVGDDNVRVKSLRRRRRLFLPGLYPIWLPSAAVDQHPERTVSHLKLYSLCRVI